MNQAAIESTMVDSALAASDSIRVLLETKIGSLQVALTNALETNHEGSLNILIGLVSLIFAVSVVLVTAIVQFLAVRKQIRIADQQNQTQLDVAKKQVEAQLSIADKQILATVRSKNRQEWINTLRNELSEFISITSSMLTTDYKHTAGGPNEVKSDFQKVAMLFTKIELLLNSKEDDHRELISLIREITRSIKQDATEQECKEMGEIQRQMIDLAKKILKSEWEKVKRGE